MIGSYDGARDSANRFRTWPEAADVGRAEHVRSARTGVIHLDAEISDRALDLGVAEQELDGSQVTGAPVDQGRLGPP